MKASTFTNTVVTLEMSVDEARWLKAVVQNPVVDPLDETTEDREIRNAFWDALEDINL